MRPIVLVCLIAGCGELTQAVVRDGPDMASSSSDLAQPTALDLAQLPTQTVDVSGTISSDTTWSGNYRITSTVTVPAGVTLAIAPGSQVQAAPGAGLMVNGTLIADGARFTAATAGQRWAGLTVKGSVDLKNAVVEEAQAPLVCDSGAQKCVADRTSFQNYSGYGITLRANATFTRIRVENGGSDGIYCNTAGVVASITDSIFHATGGDAVWFENGSLTLEHSSVYGNVVGGDGAQHCAAHFGGPGTFIVHTTDFYRSSYGIMASAMSATTQITGNNFYENSTSWGASQSTGGGAPLGVNAAANLSGNFWGGQVPSVTGNSTVKPSDPSTWSATKLSGTGPRP